YNLMKKLRSSDAPLTLFSAVLSCLEPSPWGSPGILKCKAPGLQQAPHQLSQGPRTMNRKFHIRHSHSRNRLPTNTRDYFMLYVYHLLGIMLKGLRITPLSYYTEIIEDIMNNEKRMVTSSTNKASGNCQRGMVSGIGWSDLKNDIKMCILPEKYTQLSESLYYNMLHNEHTNVAELANVLEIDIPLAKDVSMYCCLGFAPKKRHKNSQDPADTASISNLDLSTGLTKHIAFLFDSTLSLVMMRDLVPKVGRLSHKSLDSFLTELEKVQNTDEEKALTLRNTILSLHHNNDIVTQLHSQNNQLWFSSESLKRCESLVDSDPPISNSTPQNIRPVIQKPLLRSQIPISFTGQRTIRKVCCINMDVHKTLKILRNKVGLQGFLQRVNRKLDASDEKGEPDLPANEESCEMVTEEATTDSTTNTTLMLPQQKEGASTLDIHTEASFFKSTLPSYADTGVLLL
ncbi:hypothetical protein E2I00_006148, partial [Balaenoptera physalus]